MLGKLIKYEFKSTAKWFLPLYLFTLVMAPLTRILISSPIFEHRYLHIVSTLFQTLYIISILAVIIATMFLIVYRFYKSMVTEEGYLTHTLPVTSTTLLSSKLISSILWVILAIVVSFASFMILFMQPSYFQDFIHAFSSIEMAQVTAELEKYHISLTLTIVEGIVGMLLGICCYILRVYASVAIGQLFNVQKLVASFVSYFLLGFAPQVIMMIGFSIPLIANIDKFDSMENMGYMMNLLLLSGIAFEAILVAVYFTIANYIFKKKLNLE